MVDVASPDGLAAGREPAGVDQRGQLVAEVLAGPVGVRAGGDDRSGGLIGDQGAQRPGRCRDGAGHPGGDRPVPDQLGGEIVEAGQGGQADGDLQVRAATLPRQPPRSPGIRGRRNRQTASRGLAIDIGDTCGGGLPGGGKTVWGEVVGQVDTAVGEDLPGQISQRVHPAGADGPVIVGEPHRLRSEQVGQLVDAGCGVRSQVRLQGRHAVRFGLQDQLPIPALVLVPVLRTPRIQGDDRRRDRFAGRRRRLGLRGGQHHGLHQAEQVPRQRRGVLRDDQGLAPVDRPGRERVEGGGEFGAHPDRVPHLHPGGDRGHPQRGGDLTRGHRLGRFVRGDTLRIRVRVVPIARQSPASPPGHPGGITGHPRHRQSSQRPHLPGRHRRQRPLGLDDRVDELRAGQVIGIAAQRHGDNRTRGRGTRAPHPVISAVEHVFDSIVAGGLTPTPQASEPASGRLRESTSRRPGGGRVDSARCALCLQPGGAAPHSGGQCLDLTPEANRATQVLVNALACPARYACADALRGGAGWLTSIPPRSPPHVDGAPE